MKKKKRQEMGKTTQNREKNLAKNNKKQNGRKKTKKKIPEKLKKCLINSEDKFVGKK